MIIKNKTINIMSKETLEIRDITQEIKTFVKKTNISKGLINIQTKHTTATIILNENEPLLLNDIKKNLEKLAPTTSSYEHDDFEKRTVNICEGECKNGHSHCKAIYLPSNLTLNVVGGEIQLGVWQSVLFIELDRARKREIHLQIIGI